MVRSRLICAASGGTRRPRLKGIETGSVPRSATHCSTKSLRSTGDEIAAICAENVLLAAINCRPTRPHKHVVLIFNVDEITYRAGRVATLD